MKLRIGTFCSGIAAPECAWSPLGWQPAWFSEIDPFASAVLAHRSPGVPNLGDMTKLNGADLEPVDLVCAGTPCQSFSVAGLRAGMDDPRGNLALVFLRLVDQIRPRWMVWENVPGVLSSGDGRDFGAFLGALGQLGYGFAYRVLDAQYFGVPQRRRRVFVVGHLGDWRLAAAILFERHSLSGNPAPSREARTRIARSLKGGTRGGGGQSSSDGQETLVTGSLTPGAHPGGYNGQDAMVPALHTETCPALKSRDGKGPSSDGDGDGATLVPMVSHLLRAEGFDASEDGTGRGTPIVPVAYQCHGSNIGEMGTLRAGNGNETGGVPFAIQERAVSENPDAGPQGKGRQEDKAFTLESRHHVQAVAAFQTRIGRNGRGRPEEICPTLQGAGAGATSDMRPCLKVGMAVRRLTPRECERLQGFRDDWTLVEYRSKPASDGPRYRAIGNSMAVPVLRWIGERIEAVESLNFQGA